MKAEITLNLRTREVYKLFERKINNDTLFIKAILHKFNKIRSSACRHTNTSKSLLDSMEHQFVQGIKVFTHETTRYEQLLYKKSEFNQKK